MLTLGGVMSVELSQKLRDILAEAMAIEPTRINKDTLLLGNLPEFDSLTVFKVVVAIEQCFGIELSADSLVADNFSSVERLEKLIDSELTAYA